ncbi:MAG: glycerol-3-phosphate acyltransferase, partial [Nitrospiria bacterium]
MHASCGALHEAEWLSQSLSDEPDRATLGQLARRLDEDATLVIPVRIAWRIPRFDKDRALRPRDIVLGDPRHPGALRARLILLRDRRRAQ